MSLLSEREWPAVKTPVQKLCYSNCIELVEDEHQQNTKIAENWDCVSGINFKFAVFPDSMSYAELYQKGSGLRNS